MIIEFLTSGLATFWLKTAGITEPQNKQSPAIVPMLLHQPVDPGRDKVVRQYLQSLENQGFSQQNQSLWLQTSDQLLAQHQGQQLRTPASLTKVATTLAALQTWGATHRFTTEIFAKGVIQNNVLQGNLILKTEGDPLFVDTEGIAIAQQLNQLGLQGVSGDLVIQGPLTLNFDKDPQQAGERLKRLFNRAAWTPDILKAYSWMPRGTPQPQVQIAGTVQMVSTPPPRTETSLLKHQSLPIIELLRLMNIYSSNEIAEWLTEQMGGSSTLETAANQTGRIYPKEMRLQNGSGLGQTNQFSARAAVGLFQGVQQVLQQQNLTLEDAFPIMGRDRGTVEKRKLPILTTVKTGTLWNTSALVGVLPTQKQGPVWFAIMNRGDDYTDGFRRAQDELLQSLVKTWGKTNAQPKAAPPTDPQRYQSVDRYLYDYFWSH
jgi:D-alanyl-D-alanine carboxypeptidase/D-alanyl-D-alanine-endopeptidase (penicillin-binding protein 4)